MKKYFFLSLAILLVGCNAKNAKTSVAEGTKSSLMENVETVSQNDENQQLPSTAKLADSKGDCQLYLNVEKPASEDYEVEVASVWLVNKKDGVTRRLLVTNPKAKLQWEKMTDNNAIAVPILQVAAAEKACFVPGSEGLILVEGCPDARNVWTYIIDVDKMTAKQFPSTEGLIGFDENKHQVTLGSYRYHDEGGRYSVIKTYTIDGNFVSETIGEDE